MVVLETREQLEEFLAERKASLKDIEERGVEALSRYDREVCYRGDDELALRETIRLVSNHIAYTEGKLAKMPKQERLL